MISDPARFITDHLTSMTNEILTTDDDPGTIVDRYYTPDIVQISDGLRIDYERLVAHIRPIRKNLGSFRVEVHEAIAGEDRIAARYTIHGVLRDKPVVTEVYYFAEIAPDGRIRRAHLATRGGAQS